MGAWAPAQNRPSAYVACSDVRPGIPDPSILRTVVGFRLDIGWFRVLMCMVDPVCARGGENSPRSDGKVLAMMVLGMVASHPELED